MIVNISLIIIVEEVNFFFKKNMYKCFLDCKADSIHVLIIPNYYLKCF